MPNGEGVGFVDRLKADPILSISLALAIIGIILAIFGFAKNKKTFKWLGGGLGIAGGAGFAWRWFNPPVVTIPAGAAAPRTPPPITGATNVVTTPF